MSQQKLASARSASGLIAGFIAFLLWGVLVLYWNELIGVGTVDIVAHRIFWSLLTFIPLVTFTKCWPEIWSILHDRKKVIHLLCAAIAISANWLTFVWSVVNGFVIESSLGSFITPLITVFLGRVFLQEKMTRLQACAIGIAVLGVMISVIAYGEIPWIALAMACTFSTYSFLHKTIKVSSVASLFLESLLAFPFAALWLISSWYMGNSTYFDYTPYIQTLLAGTGIITIIPFLFFTYAGHRVALSTLGLLQYTGPSIKMLLGIFVLNEMLKPSTMMTLIFIWIALALYTWCNIQKHKNLKT